jgi:spore germination protein YaaH
MGKSIDLAAKPEKITDEQLKKVQQIISTSNQIKLDLGNMEARKHVLLHELDGINKIMSDINKELEEEYGKMDIDINTGAINYPEDEQADS